MKYGLSSNLIRLICVGVSAGVGVWCAVLAPSLAVTFIPPQDNSAPGHSDGGASRSSVRFIPPRDSSAPDYAAGGASRIGFIPPSDNAAPDHAAARPATYAVVVPLPDQRVAAWFGEPVAADELRRRPHSVGTDLHGP